MATNRELWETAYAASKLRDVDHQTMSGIPLDAVYGPDDGEFPGQYPYTRGPYASMYRSKLWTMRMFAGFGTAEDTNWRFKEIIKAGGTGLSTAFDMPTLLGIDSDHAMALGEVRQSELRGLVEVKAAYRPDPANRAAYDRLYAEFPGLYTSQKKFFRRLNR